VTITEALACLPMWPVSTSICETKMQDISVLTLCHQSTETHDEEQQKTSMCLCS